MQAASIAELKKTLVQLDQGELLDACLRLARYKKDNKELLTYLLFMSADENEYARYLCEEIDSLFVHPPTIYLQKKMMRKIIRWMDKCLRYSGIKVTEVQVRIHFLRAVSSSSIAYRSSPVMYNMVMGQIKKINKAMDKFHADLQFDFQQELSELRLPHDES